VLQEERKEKKIQTAPHSFVLANAPSVAIDAIVPAPFFVFVSEHVVSQEERKGTKNQYPSHCRLHIDSFSIYGVVCAAGAGKTKEATERPHRTRLCSQMPRPRQSTHTRLPPFFFQSVSTWCRKRKEMKKKISIRHNAGCTLILSPFTVWWCGAGQGRGGGILL
jgi:hypothetical protein